MKKVLTFILASFLLISCGGPFDQDGEENSYMKVFIDIDNINSSYSIHSDNYELIPLELNDQSLIGSIDKMIHYQNKIDTEYVLDFGPDRLKKETKQLFLTEMREYFMKNPYVYNAGNLVETNDYLSFQWVRSKQGYEISEDETFVSYFNKTSGELAHFPVLGNWKNGTSLNGPVFGSEAYFFGFITYDDWLKLSDAGPRKRFTDEGNPIIIKYEIGI